MVYWFCNVASEAQLEKHSTKLKIAKKQNIILNTRKETSNGCEFLKLVSDPENHYMYLCKFRARKERDIDHNDIMMELDAGKRSAVLILEHSPSLLIKLRKQYWWNEKIILTQEDYGRNDPGWRYFFCFKRKS